MSYSGPSSADNFLKQLYESTGSAHLEPKAMYTGDISEECRCLHIRKLSMLGAAVFSGVAGCITLMEQPALMKLDNANALKSWKFMYRRGAPLQVCFAHVYVKTFIFGIGIFIWLRR